MRKRLRELMLRRNSVRRMYAMTGECRAAYARLLPWQRIKDALRRWQSSQAPRMRDVVGR